MYYSFTFNVEAERSEIEKMQEFAELAEVSGAWTSLALMGEQFEAAMMKQFGAEVRVLSTSYTGDKRNTRQRGDTWNTL